MTTEGVPPPGERRRTPNVLRACPKTPDPSGGFKSLAGMAMGPVKGQAATLQIEMVCLDELVAADDRLRRLDELVDWGSCVSRRRRTTPRVWGGRRLTRSCWSS